jgi:type I restriction enzyme S subunit
VKLKPYPKYKPSGVEWLGDVPATWRVERIVDAARLFNGFPFDSSKFDASEGIPLVRIRDISKDNCDTYWSGAPVADAAIESDDLLIGMDGDFNVALWRGGSAMLNQRVCCIRTDLPALKRFLYYLLPYPLRLINDLTYSTTVKHLSSSDVNKIRFACPSHDQVKSIVSFLDRETAKINTLIAKQEKLIELLQEKRQAVISQAVMKGLDPIVPLKPSGVEWLGAVPEHWGVSPLKHQVQLESGGTPSKDKPEFWGHGYPWASAKDLKVEILTDTEDHVTQAAIDSGAASLVAEDSVLVVVRGMILLHTLPVVLTSVPMAINQDLKALKSRKTMAPSYLAWLLRGLSREILGRTDQAAHGTKALRTDDWTGMMLPLPPIKDQLAISKYLDETTRKIDTLIAKAQQAIELQQEHRTALISAAVTGKIDVRGLVQQKFVEEKAA